MNRLPHWQLSVVRFCKFAAELLTPDMATKKLIKNITLETGGVYRAKINREKVKSFENPENGLNKAIDYFYDVLDKNKSSKQIPVPAT